MFMLFMFSLMGTIMFSLMMSSWIIIILLLELSMFLFAFMVNEYKILSINSCVIKYYFTQSWSSIILLLYGMLIMVMNMSNYMYIIFIMVAALMMKMGMFPFYFWVLPVMKELPYMMIGILSTLLKIMPMNLIYFVYIKMQSYMLYLLMFLSMMSIVVSPMIGLSCASIREMLGASSINQSGWLILSIISTYMYKYFLLYMITMLMTVWSLIKNNTLLVSLSLLSLSGFPPLNMFSGKLLILYYLFMLNSSSILLCIILIFTGMSFLFYLKYSFYFYFVNLKHDTMSLLMFYIMMILNLMSSLILLL
uniref:NADH dehydrogenase subunit 2 n=1 Tax=Cochlostyla marinduquensis TaxID=2079772 RepID=UPI00233F2218|nr:NADH dehydrogenase subunit 2 [Cochlostyla marinduquensis]UIX22058.1 NADH dehydrogenase subunit 2 [Cochlostyla marinduquensis]